MGRDHLLNRPILLPQTYGRWGPATRKRLVRSCLAYLALWMVGLLFSLTPIVGLQAFGLGLILPGAGFLIHATGSQADIILHLVFALGTLALFAASLALWFATGNIILPGLVWFASALIAASMNHGHSAEWARDYVPLIIGLLICIAAVIAILRHWRSRSLRRRANDFLAHVAPFTPASAEAEQGEFSLQDLQRLRFLLDRALQPIEDFAGFDHLDQFQTAALRYQINFFGYALALAQWTRFPAIHGYLDRAQCNLIDKLRAPRIWNYWRYENFWGNLSLDPDPIRHENIMFGGFAAAQMALYQHASGRGDFEISGSFSLELKTGEVLQHDLASLRNYLVQGYSTSDCGLFACEPGWVYPLCNTIAAIAMQGETAGPAIIARLQRGLNEEFLTASGHFLPCRAWRLGFAIPPVGGALPQAAICLFLNATLPDMALRHWYILRRNLVDGEGASMKLRLSSLWPVDIGNYRFSRAASLAITAAAAVELGDRQVAQLCLHMLDEKCPETVDGGVAHRQAASNWAHAFEMMARAGGTGALHALVASADRRETGLRVVDMAYPAVLPARGVVIDDVLELVLYPGTDHAGPHRIRLAGLDPAQPYRCQGALEEWVQCDEKGEAEIMVMLDGRSEVKIAALASDFAGGAAWHAAS